MRESLRALGAHLDPLIVIIKIKAPLSSQRLIQAPNFRSIGLHSKYVGQVDASIIGSLPIAFPPDLKYSAKEEKASACKAQGF